MRTQVAVALSLFVGIGLGAMGAQTLRAQPKPPVYLIENNRLSDPTRYAKEYVPLVRQTLQAAGAAVLAAGNPTPVEGNAPQNRVIIIRFGSLDELTAWHKSPGYPERPENW